MQIPYFVISVVGVLTLLPMCASADVYRCVGTDGKTLYSDSPCPDSATQQSNITTTVGACNTAECEAKRQQEANEARERFRTEKERLDELADKRRRAELETERERAKLEEARSRSSIDPGFAAAVEADYVEDYPIYSRPPYVRPCAQRCGNLRPRPPHVNPRPPHVSPRPSPQERAVPLRGEH